MKNRHIRVVLIIMVLLFLTGCSKESVNRQIAESIGTLGKYENNEPVQTPKMRAEEEMKKRHDSIESEMEEHLLKAEELASHYDYENALNELALIDEEYQEDERVLSDKVSWQKLVDTLYEYDRSIAHFSVESLVVDSERAFQDPEMGSYYNNWSLTVDEFKKILNELYTNNYVLIDITEVAVPSTDEEGEFVFEWVTPLVPDGKIPIVISFTGTNYNEDQAKYGFSSRLVIDDEGNVQNEYADANGNTKIGAYDAIPILNEFIDKHPDFSLRGARGIVAVSGYHGIFGYGIETGKDTIKEIADRLKEQGWLFACQGYQGVSMENDLTGDEFISDMETWKEKVEPLVGETSLLIFPNGDQITVYGYKHMWAMKNGYRYYFSQWATDNHMLIYDDYMEQSRRMLDGYDLYFYGESMENYFDAGNILSKNRPAFE